MRVRGFHYYQKDWKPSVNDILTFCHEKDNPHDPFAVAIKGKLKSTVAPITVGHVPIEISRFVFFSLERGCNYSAEVLEKKPSRSPLQQGGLEIKCRVRVTCTNQELLEMLKGFILMNYSIDACLKDDSAEILKSLKVEDVSETDSELEIMG